MHHKSWFILALLASLVLAPALDVVACDDCKDMIPIRDLSQGMKAGADHASAAELTSQGAGSHTDSSGTAQDLCPVCANVAAMSNSAVGVLSTISEKNSVEKSIALSDPSYSITKPPQN